MKTYNFLLCVCVHMCIQSHAHTHDGDKSFPDIYILPEMLEMGGKKILSFIANTKDNIKLVQMESYCENDYK